MFLAFKTPITPGDAVAKDKNESINSYLTDMLALEQHIEKAIRAQLQDIKDDAEFVRELQPVHRKIEQHISDLKGLVDRRDATGAGDLLKKAGSVVAGLAAGAIDLLRTEGLPKNLRDDYTAFSLSASRRSVTSCCTRRRSRLASARWRTWPANTSSTTPRW